MIIGTKRSLFIKKTGIKKAKKIIVRSLGYSALFLLFISILLSIPALQTKLAKTATHRINGKFGTDILIKKVDLSFLGRVQLKGIEIRDHHKDTLIFIDRLSTSLVNIKKVIDNNINLGNVTLEGTHYYYKTYKGENDNNFSIFLDTFKTNQSKSSSTETKSSSTETPFTLKSSNIRLRNFNIKIIDENKSNPIPYAAKNLKGSVKDFSIIGANVSGKVKNLHFIDNRNIEITNLTTDYTYSSTSMDFKNSTIATKTSLIKIDMRFDYKREDLSEFMNNVVIKTNFKKSKISVRDLQKLYHEFSGNETLYFTGKFNGTLNKFRLHNFNTSSNEGMKIIGDLKFTNAVNYENGFVFEGDLDTISTNYKQLTRLFPNLLGSKLPKELEQLNNFTFTGNTFVNSKKIEASATITSDIGKIISDIELTDIDNLEDINYRGKIELINFDLGLFLKNNLLGNTSFKGNINGKGFHTNTINTSFIGDVSKFSFKNYSYQNIRVNGSFKRNIFKGDLRVNDNFLKAKFKGFANLSSKTNAYNLEADIANLNLKKTNLFSRSSTAVLKGLIRLDVQGTSFDNMVGTATFNNMLYANQKRTYAFKEFLISSSIKDDIKTIQINSKDLINGELKGRFLFKELLPVTQNALGSVYANYTPYKVQKNQFLEFNFSIYDKVVDLFFPEISADKNTTIKGKINAAKNSLKLTISSPKIEFYGNEIKDVLLRTDNQNKLYNTHLTASEVRTKYYTVSELNLLNRMQNDTLFFKSIFKGRDIHNEHSNVDFFYTINQEKKSVLGIQKSTIGYKNNLWKINPEDNQNNKVAFDLKKGEYYFSPFLLESGEQKIDFIGIIKENKEKDLLADFTKVKLESFLPEIDSLAIKGVLDGTVDFIEKEGLHSPKGTLLIKGFEINNLKQGDLALNIIGNNSYQKYNVALSLKRERVKSIGATGMLDFSSLKPSVDLKVFLEDFELNAFSPLGQDVLSKIRGKASGDFTLKGFIGNPEMDGNLTLTDAGLHFSYLNTDYDFKGISSVSLQNQSFILEDIKLVDSKYNSTGKLQGSITHQNFDAWFLNINILADNLVILDTEDSEESLYYGKGFIKGNVSITGLTDQLDIDINAATQANTLFILPLRDIQTINNYKLIRFKSENKTNTEEIARETIKGLSLTMNLEVTKEAIAQVVIDEVNGSQLKGSGTGNLQIEIDTRGDFNMFGDFLIDNGVYDFKYGNVINKPFNIEKGGMVSWSGNPLNANLNITAVYETKANPAVLLDNFNTNRKIPINLITKISGELFSSTQEFDIKIPNSNSNIESELNFILNDNNINEKTTQFISLLTLGSFVNPAKTGIDGSAAFTNTASSAIGSAVSNLLNDPASNFQLDLDYTQADNNDIESLNTDSQIDVSVSGQISNKIIINGKVGVPVGEKTQSSVVGEVKLEALLNESGNFRGIIFNRQNEIQYSIQEEGYTQGLGLSYQVNFNSLSGLLQKMRLKKKMPKVQEKKIESRKKNIKI